MPRLRGLTNNYRSSVRNPQFAVELTDGGPSSSCVTTGASHCYNCDLSAAQVPIAGRCSPYASIRSITLRPVTGEAAT